MPPPARVTAVSDRVALLVPWSTITASCPPTESVRLPLKLQRCARSAAHPVAAGPSTNRTVVTHINFLCISFLLPNSADMVPPRAAKARVNRDSPLRQRVDSSAALSASILIYPAQHDMRMRVITSFLRASARAQTTTDLRGPIARKQTCASPCETIQPCPPTPCRNARSCLQVRAKHLSPLPPVRANRDSPLLLAGCFSNKPWRPTSAILHYRRHGPVKQRSIAFFFHHFATQDVRTTIKNRVSRVKHPKTAP